MARLMLSLDGQLLAEYNMNKERYTIGRLPDNDIRIDNPAVSGHHSLIINILNDSFLEDLNSTNGTYVNGKLIKKHALQHGDVITAGHHQLRFVEEDAPQDEFEKTLVIQPSSRPVERLRTVASSEITGKHRVATEWRGRRAAPVPAAGRRAQEGAPAGAVRRLRRPRARTGQDPDDAGPSRRAGGGDHAPLRRLLHRARRTRAPTTASRW